MFVLRHDAVQKILFKWHSLDASTAQTEGDRRVYVTGITRDRRDASVTNFVLRTCAAID